MLSSLLEVARRDDFDEAERIGRPEGVRSLLTGIDGAVTAAVFFAEEEEAEEEEPLSAGQAYASENMSDRNVQMANDGAKVRKPAAAPQNTARRSRSSGKGSLPAIVTESGC